MKQTFLLSAALTILVTFTQNIYAQQTPPAKNMVIFVMDGYRWQELFGGADSSLIFSHKYNHHDSAYTVQKYWANTADERRKKLMPFTWETIAQKGEILGNRAYGNNVNVINKYWFSYPGRSEIFAGYFDSAVNSNEYPDNPNTNVLEYIDAQPAFHGKVVTFSSWDAVARIMNGNRNKMLINIPGQDVTGDHLTAFQRQANTAQHLYPEVFGNTERLDGSTFLLAESYFQANHPRILYIDLGDNDEFGHAGDYADYLDAAHYADRMFKEIWTAIQADPFYKDNTDLLIFPDHGRGLGAGWTSHGSEMPHSNETYFLAMGPNIPAKGEVKTAGQVYQQQYAQTIAMLLGLHFTATHPIAQPIHP